MRLSARNGKLMHASISIGGAQVMPIDESPDELRSAAVEFESVMQP